MRITHVIEEEERLLKPNTLDGRPSLRFTKNAHARATLRSVYNNIVYVNTFVTYQYPAVTIRWPHDAFPRNLVKNKLSLFSLILVIKNYLMTMMTESSSLLPDNMHDSQELYELHQ